MPQQRGGFGGGRGRGGKNRLSGPKLPSTLQAEVDAATGGSSKRKHGGGTRKDLRKASREQKRSGPPGGTRGRGVHQTSSRQQAASSESADEAEETSPLPVAPSSKTSTKRPLPETESQAPAKKKQKPELSLSAIGAGDDKENEEIKWLEWMLKHKKGKGKEKVEEGDVGESDDGLDDLLDFADTIGPGGKGLPQTEMESEEEMDGWEGDGSQDEDDDEDDSEGNSEDEEEDSPSEQGTKDTTEEPWAGIRSSNSPSPEPTEPAGKASDKLLDPSPEPVIAAEEVEHAAEGPTKYLPPHLRAAELEERAKGNKEKIEERIKLERKAQGLLNKLSEANLERILADIEQLYKGHSRNDVTTTLTSLIIQAISDKANLMDSYVVLYATMVGALHRVIGMEFGAHFVHTLVLRYHNLIINRATAAPAPASIYETPDTSKESLNLLVLISEMYNAGVVSSKLIYDLIRGFLKSNEEGEIMGESQVEGLLKVLRCSGAQLKTDDPGSLKDIVNIVQDKTKGKEKTMTSRARFMVETLTNIKNGKIKATTGTEQGVEATMRMKRFLGGLGKKRRLLAYEPLRVSLSDLLTADTKGKWWLVGAGWLGNPLVDNQPPAVDKKKKRSEVKEDEEVLLELARRQGMNTDIRRSVFVVLMTSEDYVHACDRLSLFKLSETQQREFVRVALHCCGLEKTYNPYYTLILNHLCANSYSHRFTLQYALWDFMKELGETSVGGATSSAGGERFGESNEGRKVGKEKIINVAKTLAYVVARGSMDLSMFKVGGHLHPSDPKPTCAIQAVDFTSLKTSSILFLCTFLVFLCIASQSNSPLLVLPKKASKFDAEPIEELFEKTLSNLELAQGWLWLLETELGEGKARAQARTKTRTKERVMGLLRDEREVKVVEMGLEVARGVVAKAI
ncbi:nucleolar MIF4G domain-containing protein 1, partial [Tremellales sp. Uapishka_1]